MILHRFLSLVLVLTAAAPAFAQPAADERPNIVLIMADDMGYSDLGCYGGEIDTPHLDRLAEQGVRFRQFYNNAKCAETRASLLTGLYHHQTRNVNLHRKNNHVTLAEMLGDAGYSTMMTGKWHVGRWRQFEGTPTDRGFDRYFGFLNGAVHFFTGEGSDGKRYWRLNGEPFDVPEDDFYTTDAFTDYALEFLDDAAEKGDPFFLYIAHNAPHYPLHAYPEDIEKYRGRFMKGWDRLREERHERMVEMGLIEEDWPLTPRDEIVPPWGSLSEEEKDEQDLLMAVYAAMIDRMDRNIGRVMDRLDALGVADNTLVIFLSDNGGCPYDATRTPDVPPGPAESYRTYDSEWANVSNTPFRLYKQWSHEGGSSTPLIARWPGVIEPGTMTNAIGHLIDFMPTFAELSGTEYPERFAGRDVLPMEGRSLVPILRGEEAGDREPIYWEFLGNRAVRDGKWKLVAERSKGWELYDMEADRVEMNDLAGHHPDRAEKMAAMYDEWAERVGARSSEASREMAPSKQAR